MNTEDTPKNFLTSILNAHRKTWTDEVDEIINRSIASFHNGDFPAAIDIIKQLQKKKIFRNDPMIAALHGCILAVSGDIENSNKELRRATSLLPSIAASFTAFGSIMLQLGRYDEAEQLAYKALLADPPDPEGLHLLVRIYHAARQHPRNPPKDSNPLQSTLDTTPHLVDSMTKFEASHDSKTNAKIDLNDSSEEPIVMHKESMQEAALLTIVLTSYNYAHFIAKAVQSIVSQTSQNWRLLIFDNQSTDNTLEVLEPFLKDSRIQLTIREKNIGAKNNLILGLKSVETEFVSILQADDYLENTFVEVAINQLRQHPKAPFVFFNWRHLINDTGQFTDHVRHPFSQKRSGPIRIGRYLTVCNFVPLHIAAFRTNCLTKYFDFYANSPLNQLGEQFLLKILEDAYGCGCYSGTMGGYWRRHEKQITFEHIASSVAAIEEVVERQWYVLKAPNPDYINAFLSLVTLIHISSHISFKAATDWLTGKGISYAENFGIPVAKEHDYLTLITLTIALKYSTYTNLAIIDKESLKEWLIQINCEPNFDELKRQLEIVKDREGETFLNTEEIEQICHNFFGKESSYKNWLQRHSWSKRSCQRLQDFSKKWLITPSINILVIATENNHQLLNDTINSLIEQTLCLWSLTVIAPVDFYHTQFDSKQINWIRSDLGKNIRNILADVNIDSEADWILVCEPGTYFEPIFCNLVGELINRNPEWRFIYTDEDIIDEKGNFSKPSLKPDSNLDLLRSAGYIEHACLIHSKLWRQIPSIERINSGLLLNYAAALRCHETFSEAAIGHIDDILLHYPLTAADDLQQFEDLGRLCLQEHLRRQGILAEVSPGLIKGSFFVDYSLTCAPLVSIIIPTKDRLDLLQPCVQSLLEKTRYSNYELLIVDNFSTDSATLEYLAYLPTYDQRIKIISYPHEYDFSAINNFAARQATGDFLLLLNNDTVILQENWLERLISIGLRKDVGIVGCRLVYANQTIQHAGVIIGMGGIAQHVGIELPMSDAGYMGRLQLTQNFSAVTAACLLVRKELFITVGGLDEIEFPMLFNDIDFCLKITEQGYRIVWTPYVTLIHHGNASLDSRVNTKDINESRTEKNLKSQKSFIRKWIASKKAGDPAYHRHLSLREFGWVIDGEFDVPWHPDLEPLPRIVAQPPDEWGVGHYRLIGPLKELTNSGQICSFLLPPLSSEKRFLPYVSELVRAKPTTLFLQNAFTSFHLDDLKHYAELLPDVFRVFGQDDIVFSVPQKSAAHKSFGKDTKARVRRAVSLCHRAIVTTEPIAEAMRGMVDDIRVMPNYLERSRWDNLQSPRKERRKLRVGWAGAQQHQGDLEFILPVVEATANEVDWIFMGMCLAKLRYHIAEVHNPVSFDQYPAALAALDLDLAIAPLEINRFNTAKSNLRLLEYGAVGYPVICTDIEPYRNAPVTRVPNNPQAWIDTIRSHIYDLDATRIAGEQLHEWVLSNWMLDQHLDEWLKALLPN
ncbi:MAG: glycosyltransferase [Gammaproteobacteria bacterium]|nr:glycosyltransferase [Gammaproteobacteria bacterium]